MLEEYRVRVVTLSIQSRCPKVAMPHDIHAMPNIPVSTLPGVWLTSGWPVRMQSLCRCCHCGHFHRAPGLRALNAVTTVSHSSLLRHNYCLRTALRQVDRNFRPYNEQWRLQSIEEGGSKGCSHSWPLWDANGTDVQNPNVNRHFTDLDLPLHLLYLSHSLGKQFRNPPVCIDVSGLFAVKSQTQWFTWRKWIKFSVNSGVNCGVKFGVNLLRSNTGLGSNWPRRSEIADFRSLFARSDSAVTPSEKKFN